MINSYTKDEIIGWLIKKFETTPQIQTREISSAYNIPDKFVRMFLKQLHNLQMLNYSEMGMGYVLLQPAMELYDFHSKGGFTVQDELLKKNIEKLYLEIENLKPHFSEKAELFANLSTIGATIFSALKFLP